jgi:hypothetical protein
VEHFVAEQVTESTVRRLIRFSDAVRDAVQNPETFGLTPDEVVTLSKLVERVDHQISKARRI